MPTTTDTPARPLVVPLTSEAARDPALTGGKAASLARLTGTTLPIPAGFVVTTAAYDAFVDAHHLSEEIDDRLARVDPRDSGALDAAAADIRALFSAHGLPESVERAVLAAWDRLAEPLVAVRSSATAEDLPTSAFAGQHESFLNIAGPRALRRAIVDCWNSLWTARAIAYRAERGAGSRPPQGLRPPRYNEQRLPADRNVDCSARASARANGHLSMAVLVQTMIAAEYAGVAFTANPTTGRRGEIVIEAVRGLGDVLVSGAVVPEAIVPDAVAAAVRQLAERLAEITTEPQDLEWAWTPDTGTFLLQARPITSLFPLPDDPLADTRVKLGDGLRAYASFGAIQGMLDPMTPLGRDNIRGLFSGAQNLFGLGTTWESERTVVVAGERLWVDVTPLLHHRIGRRLLGAVLSVIEPRIGEILRSAVPHRSGGARRMHLKTALRIPRVFGPMAMRLIGSFIAPEWSRRRAEQHLERLAAGPPVTADDTVRSALAVLQSAWRDGFPTMIPHAMPRIMASVICQRAIGRLTRHLPDAASASLIVSRGIPHNVTSDMNRALWTIAQEIRGLPALRAMVAGSDATGLATAVLDDRLPPAIERSLAAFLNRYGARGLAEIDLGRPRWAENPAPVLQALQAYVRAERPASAEASAATAGREATQLVAEWERALRERRGGFVRARLLAFCYNRYRTLAGLREAPKFAIMRRLAKARHALRAAGEALTQEGLLDRGEDIFFLHVRELTASVIPANAGIQSWMPPSAGMTIDNEGRGRWRALVQERREAYERETRRAQIPLVLLSDGSALFGVAADDDDGKMRGTPVSPGIAEGTVRVIDRPDRNALVPGEILVCRATDPSWTPLFFAAGGLITEVGGVMSHGAIVARECGLPAIVGVPDATTRLTTGQRVRLDGASGRIVVIRA